MTQTPPKTYILQPHRVHGTASGSLDVAPWGLPAFRGQLLDSGGHRKSLEVTQELPSCHRNSKSLADNLVTQPATGKLGNWRNWQLGNWNRARGVSCWAGDWVSGLWLQCGIGIGFFWLEQRTAANIDWVAVRL